jgi:AAA domain/Bacterial regulatory protein, arsR family
MSNVTEFTYSTRKQDCPCGQSRSYTPLTSHTSGGKCHSSKCGQRFFPPEPPPKASSNHDEQVYPYRDLKGKTVFETVRYYKNGEKSFYQRRPTANGGYDKGLGQGANRVPLVLYNLPEITQAIAQKQQIFIVEGEKDVETLKRNGLVATCNPMGAGKWRSEFNSILRDANVIVLPDNDEAGKAHGDKVARELSDVAASVRIIDLPNLPDKGDVSDWLMRGNSVQELCKIASETPLFDPKHHSPIQSLDSPLKTLTNDSPQVIEPIRTQTLSAIMATELPPLVPIVDTLLFESTLNILAARPKQGKSWLALAISIAVGSGTNFMGKFATSPHEVLYFDLESSQRRIKQRAGVILANEPAELQHGTLNLHIATSLPRMDRGGLEALKLTLQQNHRIKLVIIDTWARFWGTRRGLNAYSEDYDEGAKLQELAKELHIAILVVHHTKKATEDYALDELSGTTGITAAADAIFMLRRKGDSTIFHCTGRDIASQDYAVQFDEQRGVWKILGSAAEAAITAERALLLQFLKLYERPMKTGELASMTGKSPKSTNNLLSKLKEQGFVRSPSYGCWEYAAQIATTIIP